MFSIPTIRLTHHLCEFVVVNTFCRFCLLLWTSAASQKQPFLFAVAYGEVWVNFSSFSSRRSATVTTSCLLPLGRRTIAGLLILTEKQRFSTPRKHFCSSTELPQAYLSVGAGSFITAGGDLLFVGKQRRPLVTVRHSSREYEVLALFLFSMIISILFYYIQQQQ